METANKKEIIRIVLDKHLQQDLEALKQASGLTIAENLRKAARFYLMFADDTGAINDGELLEFIAEWRYRNKKKRAVK